MPADNPTDRAVVFDAIEAERVYQDKKWGSIAERPHTVGEWLLILQDVTGRACEAWREGDIAALAEIVQVAGVAVACLEQHGPVTRDTLVLHATADGDVEVVHGKSFRSWLVDADGVLHMGAGTDLVALCDAEGLELVDPPLGAKVCEACLRINAAGGS